MLVGGAAPTPAVPMAMAGALKASLPPYVSNTERLQLAPCGACRSPATSHACLYPHPFFPSILRPPPLHSPRSELAESVGIEHWGRVPALNTNE